MMPLRPWAAFAALGLLVGLIDCEARKMELGARYDEFRSREFKVVHDVRHTESLGGMRLTIQWEPDEATADVHHLAKVGNLYAPDARIWRSDGGLEEERKDGSAKHTFRGDLRGGGWILVTKAPKSGKLLILLQNRTAITEIHHHERLGRVLDDAQYRLLKAQARAAGSGYYASEPSLDEVEAQPCGALKVPPWTVSETTSTADGEQIFELSRSTDLHVSVDDRGKYGESRRQLRQRTAVDDHDKRRSLLDPFAFYPGCYDDDDRLHELHIGIATDKSFFMLHDQDLNEVEAEVEWAVSQTSQIYQLQMNVLLRVKDLRMAAAEVPSSWHPVFHQHGDDCPVNMDQSLRNITTFVRALPRDEDLANWHLFTNCKSPDRVVGTAYMGTLCERYFNTAVSGYSGSFWVTLAHEMGHAFGGAHSFENGVGKTGGIMDYGNGKLLNTPYYRFRDARKPEMCKTLSRIKNEACKHFAISLEFATGCGDRLLAADEECECPDGTTSCTGCVGCKLQDVSQECSSTFFMRPKGLSEETLGELSDSSCCVNGKMLSSADSCPEHGGGYCSFGKCTNTCASRGLVVCDAFNGGCRSGCRLETGTTCSPNWRWNGEYISNMRDGSACNLVEGVQGQCESGQCVDMRPPTKFPTQSPTNPTPSPSKHPTGRPTSRPSTSPTTAGPTTSPTKFPTRSPSKMPTEAPSSAPTKRPTRSPTEGPTPSPTQAPTQFPTKFPSKAPSPAPTQAPTQYPTRFPTRAPTESPTQAPTRYPTRSPTMSPTPAPTMFPTFPPTQNRGLVFSTLCKSGKSKCSVPGSGLVRFGASDEFRFHAFTKKATFACTKSFFRVDPLPGKSKVCSFMPMGFKFTAMGNEGAQLKLNKPMVVRFGYNGKFVFKTFDQPGFFRCAASEFGVNPNSKNVRKQRCWGSPM